VHNYRANSRATGLATGRAMAIGHVIPVLNRNDVVNPIFAEFVAGASQTYSAHGYELILTIAEEQSEGDAYRNLAAKGAVDGFIVHSPRREDFRMDLLNDIGLPFVVHGRTDDPAHPYSWIDMNNKQAFEQACKLLLDLGHRRIALINGAETLNFAWRRRLGYEAALSQAKVALDNELMFSGELTEELGHTAASQMLSMLNPPTAFIASSYIVALGIKRAIAQAKLEMGRDVSVIIHDDELSYFHNHGEVPQFTATRSSVRSAGELGAQMLIDLVGQAVLAPQSRLLEARLTIGASTGPAPDRQTPESIPADHVQSDKTVMDRARP